MKPALQDGLGPLDTLVHLVPLVHEDLPEHLAVWHPVRPVLQEQLGLLEILGLQEAPGLLEVELREPLELMVELVLQVQLELLAQQELEK